LDVVTRDPLAAVAQVGWADRDAEVLSMFDPVHLGLGEDGRPVRMCWWERSLLIVGLAGTGKSSLLQLLVSHAGKSPDAALVCIDPNEVQLAPWQDRAWLYAGADMDDALEVAAAVQTEMTRRLAWLRTQPGVVRKVGPDSGLPLIVYAIDELAYHCSIAGTGAQRAAFAGLVRDVVARGRAAGIIPVVATQRPTNEVVPASLSGLFSMRAAGRVADTDDSDRVLGKGTAKAGWDASTIPVTDRGVLIATSEDGPAQRFKAAWIDDATIADLATTTIRYRPPAPAHRVPVRLDEGATA
jgi:S-DNA-T family DNA segregation ATPase FtsK/SpoIIIE